MKRKGTTRQATFFLVSTEHGDWGPLECTIVRRLSNAVRDDLALVGLRPKILKHHYGTPSDLDEVILGAKHEGGNIFSIATYPLGVYVCAPKKATTIKGKGNRVGDLKILDWGALFPSLEEAEADLRLWDSDAPGPLGPYERDMSKRRACPCCGYLTFSESSEEFAEKARRFDEVCPVCFWEDDEAQSKNPTLEDGLNAMSLVQARENFATFGAATREHEHNVREPRPEEMPPPEKMKGRPEEIK